MTLADLGITKSDFEDFAYADWGREITRIAKTKTISNTTGSPTYTGTTSATITAIFTKRGLTYNWDKEGMVERGDAFLQCKEDQTISKDDFIIVDSETFRVDDVLPRIPGGTRMFKSCVLFKVANS